MPFTRAAVETFISDKVTNVTECNAADIGAEFPNATNWISAYGLMAILVNAYSAEGKALALQFLRRTETAIAEYSIAREALQDLVTGSRGRWSPYFRALSHFEVAIAQLYQAYDFSRKALGTALFEPADGSALNRLNLLYNASKHQSALGDQPVWITNEGFECGQAKLSFAEIEDLLRQCGRISTKVTTNVPAASADV